MNVTWVPELIREGLRNLLLHKLRSALTLLGVVCGVGAVITMLGIGEGAQRTVLKEIEGLGLGNIIVDSVQPSEAGRTTRQTPGRGMRVFRYGLTRRDVAQFQSVLPSATLAVSHLVKQKVYCGAQRLDAAVLGVPADYFRFFSTEILQGHILAPLDDRDRHRVAVVTDSVAAAAHVVGGVLGRNLRIGNDYFEIVGVVRLPLRTPSGMVYIPSTTAECLYGDTTRKRESGSMEFTRTEVGQVIVRLDDEQTIPAAAAVVGRTLRLNHSASDFALTVPLDLLRSKQRTQRILNLVLIAIAAISLLVGGIGIMNIMLANVTERIPEIGVRRAIGATRLDILWQFLTETVVLSSAGGILGCLLGFATVPIASQFTGWPGVITLPVVLAALAVSWLVGVVFGLAPAVRASGLHPVDCLHYE